MAAPKPSGTPNIATIAGVLVFVGGGLATVLSAVTNFGASGGALEVARRNHTWMIVTAAALASAGLALGATYTIIRETWKTQVAKIAETACLIAAVVTVSVGVVFGVWAAVWRQAGRPAIALTRTGAHTVDVAVTAEGLSSGTSYEARIEGWNQPEGTPGSARLIATLLAGRFSPKQDGTLSWQQTLDIGTPPGVAPINYLLVIVAKDAEESNTCVVAAGGKQLRAPTCLYTRIPPLAPKPSGG